MRVGLWAHSPACGLSCLPTVTLRGLPHLHLRQPHLQREADHGAHVLTTAADGGGATLCLRSQMSWSGDI